MRKNRQTKKNRYQRQIKDLRGQIEETRKKVKELSENLEHIISENTENTEHIEELSQRVEELSEETSKNTNQIRILLRAREILQHEMKTSNDSDDVLGALRKDKSEKRAPIGVREIGNEFIEVIEMMKAGQFNPRDERFLIARIVITILSKEATPEDQKSFWKLVKTICKEILREATRGETKVSQGECANILQAILASTDLLQKNTGPRGNSIFVFNRQSRDYKKILSPLRPIR